MYGVRRVKKERKGVLSPLVFNVIERNTCGGCSDETIYIDICV